MLAADVDSVLAAPLQRTAVVFEMGLYEQKMLWTRQGGGRSEDERVPRRVAPHLTTPFRHTLRFQTMRTWQKTNAHWLD